MEKLVEQIRMWADAQSQKTLILAIDGSCTAGKSTLANRLKAEFDCNLFFMDDFFLRPEQRTRERLDRIGGNVDYERFRAEVLEPLKTGQLFSYHPFDCSTGRLGDPVPAEPKRINIIEGSYSHHPYFGDPYDLKIFLDVSPEVRERRILARPAFLHRRFFEQWIPMEQRYFEAFGIREKADILYTPEENQ